MITEADLQMAPCLGDSAFKDEAQALIEASRTLGTSGAASVLRGMAIVHCFDTFERLLAAGEEPLDPFGTALKDLTGLFSAAHDANLGRWNPDKVLAPGTAEAAVDEPVVNVTGEHYGRLFAAFGDRSYWEEPKRILETRLSRNEVAPESWQGKAVLDAGCGGGRYTAAWRLLGAGSCEGVDMSTVGLENARERVAQGDIDGVSFVKGNVLSLPFEADRFDVVFSNGVLHHTSGWKQGVNEAVRVLKSGGLGWLYLIENPGGLFWDMIELLRVLTHGDERSVYRDALRTLGVPSNRIFYMLDHVMVPINLRLSPAEIEGALTEAGASDIRRLNRGTDFDRVEHLHQKTPHAEAFFGAGENRYVFSK